MNHINYITTFHSTSFSSFPTHSNTHTHTHIQTHTHTQTTGTQLHAPTHAGKGMQAKHSESSNDDPFTTVVLQAKARKNRTSHRVQKAQKVRNFEQF